MTHDLLTIHVPGEIRGKGRPRFRRFGNYVKTYTDPKTASAETWIKACALEQVGQPMLTGPLSVAMVVTVPIPTSWPKKRQADALSGLVRPTAKPDLDNSIKLLCDSLNRIVWHDDSQVVTMTLRKVYGEEPGALIEVGTA